METLDVTLTAKTWIDGGKVMVVTIPKRICKRYGIGKHDTLIFKITGIIRTDEGSIDDERFTDIPTITQEGTSEEPERNQPNVRFN